MSQQPKYKLESLFSQQKPHPFVYYSCYSLSKTGNTVRVNEPLRSQYVESYLEKSS